MSRKRALAIGLAAFALLTGVVLAFLYVRGGGPAPSWLPFRPAIQDPLAPSLPAEQVLRSVRLAGFEHAVAGDEAGTALVRIEIPAANSPADLELAWQTGAASLASAYPAADRYVVQVFASNQPLLELRWTAEDVHSALEADDAASLRSSAEVVHLRGDGDG